MEKKKRIIERKISEETVEESLGPMPPRTVEAKVCFRIFKSANNEDMAIYHTILNNPDRFYIIEQRTAWDRMEGLVTGMTLAVQYSDSMPNQPLNLDDHFPDQ